jgi:uncharacterized protein (TIGR03437 family)
MDAAYTTLKKAVLFLSFTLVSLGFWSSPANAQPAITACSPIATTFQGISAVPCAVSTTSGSISFTSSITYSPAAPTQSGWLSVDPSSGTIPDTVQTLQLTLRGIAGLVSGTTYRATITLTPTSPANAIGTSITLAFTYNSGGGGGGGTGAITASSLQAFCPNSSTCQQTQTLTLSTTSATAINFSLTAPNWITLGAYSGSVSGATGAQISVQVNNYNTATTGQYITVYYSNTSFTVQIPVTTSGGGGSGIISPNLSTLNLCYNTGGAVPTGVVNFTDTGNPTMFMATSVLTTSGDPLGWLLISAPGSGSGATGFGFVPVSGGTYINVTVDSGLIGQLITGAHNGTVTIADYPGNNQATFNVVLNVNNAASCAAATGGLTVTPSSIQVPSVALNSTSTVTTSATVSSSVTGTFNNVTTSGACNGIYAAFSNNSVTGNGLGVTLTVYGSANGNSSVATTETCYLYLNLLSGSTSVASATIPVTWTIGSGGSGGGASNPVLPTSLSFATENNSIGPLTPQLVTITAAGAWTATTSANWITVPASGTSTGTSTTLVSVNPAGLTTATSPYTGTVTFNTAAGQQIVSVSLWDTPATPVLYGNQTYGYSLQSVSGSIIGSSNPIQVLASDSSSIAFAVSSSASWIVASPSSGNTTNNSVVSFSIDPSNLANGVYSGNIIITASAAANSPLNIPIVLTVSGSSVTGGGGSGSLTFSPSAITFNAQVSGAAPQAQAISVSDPGGISYYAQASGTNNGITWLFVSPANSYIKGSQSFNVTVNQTGLPLGIYTGNVNFIDASGNSQSVTVTMNVTTTGGGGGTGSASSSPSSLNFSANQGGALPGSQSLNITLSGNSSSFSLTTTQQNGGNNTWLSATTNMYATGATVTVNVNPANLSAGTYNGAVVITPSAGTALSVPITLVVTGLPVISASPATLNLSYSVGGTPPTASVSVNGGAGLNYLATVSSTCNCIAISPASGDTTASPSIAVTLTNPTSLTAGTYTGTITVSGTNNSSGSTLVNVTLTVTAPLPTISAVANAASGVIGTVSPGEIVSIFAPASNPIGPATAVKLSGTDLVNGNVPTTGLGGVKVTFNGYPAPVLYASSTQINAVVPYAVAGFSGFPVVVTYLGQTSNGYTVRTATTVPGIFTQNAAGSGPADVLNSDGITLNGPNAPAAKGSTVSVYMTGEGALTPKVADGTVTCSAGCTSISQIPIPLLKVAVLVDNQPAQVVFYGEAPGLVSGIMQINFVIPSTAHSGAVSLAVSVGANQSQSDVTINVQ